MDAVITPGDERGNTEAFGYLMFEKESDGMVYVAFDRRATNLPGRANGFTCTGYNISISLSTRSYL